MTDSYTYQCTIVADNDCPGVTIKLTETDEPDGTKHDANFFFADRHEITADKPYTYKVSGQKLPLNDAHAMTMVFDFGGTPAGTHVKISDIILVKE